MRENSCGACGNYASFFNMQIYYSLVDVAAVIAFPSAGKIEQGQCQAKKGAK